MKVFKWLKIASLSTLAVLVGLLVIGLIVGPQDKKPAVTAEAPPAASTDQAEPAADPRPQGLVASTEPAAPPAPAAAPAPAAPPAPVSVAKGERTFERFHEADRYIVWCTDPTTQAECETGKDEIRALYVKAYKGDYQAQRNLAWMLQQGTFPARKDALASCIWRLIITSSKSPSVDSSDFANMRLICGRLSPDDYGQATVQAMTLAARMVTDDPIEDETRETTGLDSTAEPLQ